MISDNCMDEAISNLLDSVIQPSISVVGCGGAGCNIVSSLYERKLDSIQTIAVNTDIKGLDRSNADVKIYLGKGLIDGKGADGNPEVVELLGETAREDLKDALTADIIFIVAGLGGGTGTGIAPIIAEIAKENGAVTIVIALLPFQIEARHEVAQRGLEKLREVATALITVDNSCLEKFALTWTLREAFGIMDRLVEKLIEGVIEHLSRSFLTTIAEEVESVAKEIEATLESKVNVQILSPPVIEAATEMKPVTFDSDQFAEKK